MPPLLPTALFRSGARSWLACAAVAVCLAKPSPAQQEEDILLEKRERELPEWAVDSFKRVDAGYDGWRSEVLHDASKPILKKVVAFLGDRGAKPLSSDYLADGFQVYTALRPAELTTSVTTQGITVQRAKELAPLQAEASLEELALPLRQALGGLHPHPFTKFVDIQVVEGGMRGRAIVHWSDQRADGTQVQINSTWMTEWEVDDQDQTKLRGLAVLDYEEIVSKEALFREVTGHVFGKLPFWNREVLTGVDDYQNKTDRLISQSFIGNQGFAVGDVNGDGRDDLYLCNHGGIPNRLLIRSADGRVRDATKQSGIGFLETTRSALFLDLDNDGDQDFVCSLGPNLLVGYNNGRGTFGDFTPLNGTGLEEIYSISSADADNDGDLDLYAVRYVANGVMGGVPVPYYNANNGASNFYWRNDGFGKWTDATAEVGLDQGNSKFSLASIWDDFDSDGDMDLYVANDFGDNNLYLNEGGKFRDVAMERGANDRAAGMGASTADFDLDGDMDILITNMFSSAGLRIAPQNQFQGEAHSETRDEYIRHARGNTLLANNGDGSFSDVTDFAGMAVAGWSWGSKFVDFNNDGYADIYSPNGFLTGPIEDDL